MPGELANVVSGRVANLPTCRAKPCHGRSVCLVNGCGWNACRLLQTRQVDVMLAGATDRTMDPATFAKFSAIGALSPTHSSPSMRANGFVMGEGAGVLVLKRLSDAIQDGDEIYSVIRGIGGSSDGRGKGITAPSQRGQIQAIARAYSQAGYPASTVELVEAHGTSTKVGDATELSTLSRLWTGIEGSGNVAVGSIKSQIGHLKAAAGIAGIMKSVMALHHRTIPPSANFETPNPTVDWTNIPFFVPTSPLEWPRPAQHRRAGGRPSALAEPISTSLSRAMSPISMHPLPPIGTSVGRLTAANVPSAPPSLMVHSRNDDARSHQSGGRRGFAALRTNLERIARGIGRGLIQWPLV